MRVKPCFTPPVTGSIVDPVFLIKIVTRAALTAGHEDPGIGGFDVTSL